MAVDVVVVAADEPLRHVLEVALAMDGFRVRTAMGEADALSELTTRLPDVLLLDATMPLSNNAAAWSGHHAPRTPAVLLESARDVADAQTEPDVIVLPMPFGLRELRLALANAVQSAAHALA
jgi:DNA-binding NtrC family response regulator